MNKPVKQTRTYYDYHQCQKYLQEKYGYDERDYFGRHKLGYSVKEMTDYGSGAYGENEYYYSVGW